MPNIDQKLEAWKNKLLDLGKRNRLLNYRDSKRSNLRIQKPSIFELWNSFVVNENPIKFPYYDEDQISLLSNEQEIGLERNVMTNQTIKDQQKTLRNLREKAKTAMEEQGVNILYLSFGFLKWSEDVNSEQYFLSPIILVPVTLTLESITSPYELSLHEDEISLNPTIAFKMSNDFGIDLPEFDAEENLSDYFSKVNSLIKTNSWEVVHETGLSLLSFLKINMYRDLEIHNDKIKGHPIVRALTGDTTAIGSTYEDVNDFDHDAHTLPSDIFQVVDADSSQQDTVLLAKKGVSFVLQGPPGTGKSQTITNIIAECLASGKKVLFVSEKMAALEVVRKRLTSAGLHDFCLTLHSYKANKKDVLEQLSSVLSLSRQRANLSDGAYQKLDLLQEDKQKLNEYAQQIFTTIEPLGKTIYQVNGELANLESYENIVFSLENVASTTPHRFNRHINLLSQFATTIGKMSDDYKTNPWNNAHVPAVTNELSHDIGAYLSKLLPKIKDTTAIYDCILTDLQLDHTPSFTGFSKIISILNIAKLSPQVPFNWIVGEDIAPLWNEVDKFSELKIRYKNAQNELLSIYNELSANDSGIPLSEPNELFSLSRINCEIEKLDDAIFNTYCYSVWNSGNFQKAQALFATTKQNVENILGLQNKLLSTFEREILNVDFRAMLLRFKTDYTSFFKIFRGQYRTDKKTIKGLYKQIVKKVSDAEIIETLTSLRKLDEFSVWLSENNQILTQTFGEHYSGENTDLALLSKLIKAFNLILQSKDKLSLLAALANTLEECDADLQRHYDFLYKGMDTDWSNVLSSLNWANDFKRICENCKIGTEFIRNICTNESKIGLCAKYSADLTNAIDDMNTEFLWFLDIFENKDNIKGLGMPALYDRVTKCMNGLSLLEEWIDFRNARTNCQNDGLADYITKIEELHIDAALIIPMFKKRFYRLWLDAILPQYPAVLNFRRRVQENIIDEFSRLDKLQFEIAKARIKKKLIDSLPSFERFTSGVDELSILKRELGKQRRIMPIRKLFRAIPNLLLTLKPCLMMSPLSVSLFLEAESYDFDTIIFDEASQVCTENAIGAISRGKQVVIAGDSKQLPPTNFFMSSTSDADFDSDTDDDEYDDTNAYESILDEAGLLPERTLLWHYRSRHEHLIAFSNAKIYKNNLITFPANIDKVPHNGVEYIYVSNGYYDRGGKKGNMIEAKRIGELVFDHFRKFPNRSLGVIAFGEVQQQAIDTVIRQKRKENQQYESFFNEDNDEAFFIKNLENVQGDERDTIIFSIGYAKDATGKFAMNFGPLTKDGGERRLNVAITRAKHNVKLVGSILPTDIEVERITREGPKLLRSYIDFAMNGPSVLLREITESDVIEHDSPFEAAVYNYLDRKGYKLATQVGCSGYRIDMAVKHPTIRGQYVVGIECDGAAYHSARTARERDRLRQAVLEDMGWKIHRVWSTDWIKDPVTEGQKLIDAIESAINNYAEVNEPDPQMPLTQVESEFLSINEKEGTTPRSDNIVNPYGFENQVSTDFSSLPRNASGYLSMGDCIKAVVDNEYPIHYELLCKNLAPLLGNEKATVKVRREVDYALKSLKSVVRKGDFFYPSGYTKVIPKATGNTRPINYINTDELAEAMLVIVSNTYGILKDSLLQSTAREYGFGRTGEKIQITLQKAYAFLLKSGRVKETDGKVVAV
ncbi:MAG: ATP-dependent RecD-like DNA helicase [Candidatus Dichloromethanomonas elyunquensis]|nr:MAG: ATP-dependent RecD-like DNA helicase [Candidatus Dichloromethanomonas elyunquensis]